MKAWSAPHSSTQKNGHLLRVRHFVTSGGLCQDTAHCLCSVTSGISKSWTIPYPHRPVCTSVVWGPRSRPGLKLRTCWATVKSVSDPSMPCTYCVELLGSLWLLRAMRAELASLLIMPCGEKAVQKGFRMDSTFAVDRRYCG